jgi:hypothetical protein
MDTPEILAVLIVALAALTLACWTLVEKCEEWRGQRRWTARQEELPTLGLLGRNATTTHSQATPNSGEPP